MKLIEIKPKFFRAFGNSDWISLDSNVVVLYGPNGFGKTCLSEAIEWLFYGKTKRRENGEKLSKRDYQGSYRNVHAPQAEKTSVSAKLRLADGSEHELCRVLHIDQRNIETTETFIDGINASFDILGLSNKDVHSPIIAQDALQEFIHSAPKDRRDKISAIFGLEPLIKFTTTLDKARTRFQQTPPEIVADAKNAIRLIQQFNEGNQFLAPLLEKWVNEDFGGLNDLQELIRIVGEWLKAEPRGIQEALDMLRIKRIEIAKQLFDDTPIKPPINLEQMTGQFDGVRESCLNSMGDLINCIETYLNQTAAVYSEALLKFWEEGLRIRQDIDQDKCPMCEENTLTLQKREQLKNRLDAHRGFLKSKSDLRAKANETAEQISVLTRLLAKLFPPFLNQTQREQLTVFFADDDRYLVAFITIHDGVLEQYNNIKSALETQRDIILALEISLRDPERVDTAFINMGEVIELLKGLSEHVCGLTNAYTEAYRNFEIQLQQRLADKEDIQIVDGLIKALEGSHSILVMSEYKRLNKETRVIKQECERHLQEKQRILLNTVGAPITNWYELLNPGANAKFTGMVPRTEGMEIHGKSFEVPINAVGCLSHCQLNCLGLSVHFTRLEANDFPYKFMIIDDPVQSMDDTHAQTLVVKALQRLMDHGFQIIICTHDRSLVNSIKDTYRNLYPLMLRVIDFPINGPDIQNEETLDECLSRAVMLSRGNENLRRDAVTAIRRSCGLLIRENCRKHGVLLPHENDTENQMLTCFVNCPNVQTGQTDSLRQTIRFSSPAPHTDPNYAVPTIEQIRPHIDRLRELGRTLDLLR